MIYKTAFLIVFLVMISNAFGLLRSSRNIASLSRTKFPSSFPSRQLSLNVAKLYGAESLLSQTDVFIFDCDGVIWKGDYLIEGVPAVLDKVKNLDEGNGTRNKHNNITVTFFSPAPSTRQENFLRDQ